MLTDAPPVKVKWNDEDESAAHKVKMNRCCSTWTPASQQEEPVAEVKECYYPRGQVGRTMKLVSEFLEGTFMVSGNALRVVSSGLAIVLQKILHPVLCVCPTAEDNGSPGRGRMRE